MPTSLKALRDYNENDVLNGFYSWSGNIPAYKGTFVKIASGWNTETDLVELGSPGAAYNNVVSQRIGLPSTVAACTNTGDNAIGCLLYDVRELDENGLPLKWDSAKQARMQCVLSGQSTVVLRNGLVLYSGVNGGNTPVVGVVPGAPAYLAADGGVSTTGSAVSTATKIGKFMGVPDAKGWVLLDIQLA
jgi:hypothetical protein